MEWDDIDAEFIFCIVVVGLLLVAIGFFILAMFDMIIYNPHRATEAQDYCLKHGFDNYKDYSGFLREHAYGIQCEYADYSKKQIQIKW